MLWRPSFFFSSGSLLSRQLTYDFLFDRLEKLYRDGEQNGYLLQDQMRKKCIKKAKSRVISQEDWQEMMELVKVSLCSSYATFFAGCVILFDRFAGGPQRSSFDTAGFLHRACTYRGLENEFSFIFCKRAAPCY